MTDSTHQSAVTIFGRVFDPEKIDLSPDAASSLLKLAFEPCDHDRMRELLAKNQTGQMSLEERAELESYRQVACLLDMIHAKARLVLNKLAAVR